MNHIHVWVILSNSFNSLNLTKICSFWKTRLIGKICSLVLTGLTNVDGFKLFAIGHKSVADLGGVRGTPPPPRGTHILSISCSFRENLAKSYVSAPSPRGSWRSPGEILDPPLQIML